MPTPGIYIGDLMLKMIQGKTGEISRVQFSAQKPACAPYADGETFLPRATPESQGLSSAFCEEMIRRLYENKECNMHRLMIVKNGYVVAECNFHPFRQGLWHVTYSMCKSVTGMAIGLLIDEGKLRLDDALDQFFETPKSGFSILRGSRGKNATGALTVRQLLTMSTGVSFNESGAISGNQWSAEYMDSTIKFEPGTQFEYNSMNSYMLSAIVTKLTGQTLLEYLKPRLFDPMGIRNVFWESSPEGVSKGGWGMYLTIEDMAKLGLLYLQKGAWNAVQIIPRDWAEQSVQPQIATGRKTASHYGYQLWLGSARRGAFAFNGMLGQDVFAYPDVNLLVVTQAGNDDVFQQSPMSTTIHSMIGETSDISLAPIAEDPAAYARLTALVKSVAGATSLSAAIEGGWQSRQTTVTTGTGKRKQIAARRRARAYSVNPHRAHLRGASGVYRRYITESLNGALYEVDYKSCGVLPLMMQIVHNNFTDGIGKIGFHLDDDGAFYMELYEGDAVYLLPLNFDNAARDAVVDMHGELYLVNTRASAYVDPDGALTLQCDVVFLEEAATRVFAIAFDKTLYPATRLKSMPTKAPLELTVTLDETPGSDMMIQTLKNVAAEAAQGVIKTTLDTTGATHALGARVRGTVRPELHLKRI